MLSEKHQKEYLKRINTSFADNVSIDFLKQIHRAHLEEIPFENLDITFGESIVLSPEKIYRKIVREHRGGFCYELNSCFDSLLTSLGFNTKKISAKVYNGGNYGPEFDHLCLIVDIEGTSYLVDVGFGDLFQTPLPINGVVSIEDYSSYKVSQSGCSYILLKSSDEKTWIPQYKFTLQEREICEFSDMCNYHQTSVDSSFTSKTVCTRLTKSGGRITLSNNKKIETKGNTRHESVIPCLDSYTKLLKSDFGINLTAAQKTNKWFNRFRTSGT